MHGAHGSFSESAATQERTNTLIINKKNQTDRVKETDRQRDSVHTQQYTCLYCIEIEKSDEAHALTQ